MFPTKHWTQNPDEVFTKILLKMHVIVYSSLQHGTALLKKSLINVRSMCPLGEIGTCRREGAAGEDVLLHCLCLCTGKSHWKAFETLHGWLVLQARFDGTVMRPMSAPVRRIISLMDNQEPVFGKTYQHADPQLRDVYPHKELN